MIESSPITPPMSKKQVAFDTFDNMFQGKGILLLCGANYPDKVVRNQLLDVFKAKKVVSRYTRNLDMILCYPHKDSLDESALNIIASSSGIAVIDADKIGLTSHLELNPPSKTTAKSQSKKRKPVAQCSPECSEKAAKKDIDVGEKSVHSIAGALLTTSPAHSLLTTTPAPALLTTPPAPALLTTPPAPALLTTPPAPALLAAQPAAVTPLSSQSSIAVTTSPSQPTAEEIEDYAEDIGILNTVTGRYEHEIPIYPEVF